MSSYTKHYERNFQKKVDQFNRSMKLPDYFAPMIGDKKRVKIADVGSALVNTLGDSWDGVAIEMFCSDKYADDFNHLWKKNKQKPLHLIEYQDMEFLTYAGNFFDIVHCRNAIDHTKDAITAIDELKRVSKEWVYLEHAPNQKSTYGGHHYWDVTIEEDRTKFSNGKTWIYLRDFKSHINSDGHIVSIWQKK